MANDNTQAFPGVKYHAPADGGMHIMTITGGMTLRQYAAIKLRVPNSGTDWLDEMICTSLRDEVAAKAMLAGINASSMRPAYSFEDKADRAYKMADAMMEARNA